MISFVRASGEVVVSVVLEMSFCCWGGGVVLMVLVAEVVVLVAGVLVAGVLVAGVVVVAVVVPVACLVGGSLEDSGGFFWLGVLGVWGDQLSQVLIDLWVWGWRGVWWWC